jgi:hypothetical protein
MFSDYYGDEFTSDQKSEEYQTRILGILIERDNEVVKTVQRLLTAYGSIIRTRLGVNEVFFGEPAGLIILELSGDKAQMDMLEKDLMSLRKIHLQRMIF